MRPMPRGGRRLSTKQNLLTSTLRLDFLAGRRNKGRLRLRHVGDRLVDVAATVAVGVHEAVDLLWGRHFFVVGEVLVDEAFH